MLEVSVNHHHFSPMRPGQQLQGIEVNEYLKNHKATRFRSSITVFTVMGNQQRNIQMIGMHAFIKVK
jgi:hypothetical protein